MFMRFFLYYCLHLLLFIFRFKTEVANVLESFVEKEDEYIKQVMQKHFTFTHSDCNLAQHPLKTSF